MTVEEILRLELPNNLPGFESYKPLNLMNRPSVSKDLLADKSLKKAGVLALLVAGDNPYFLLTERNAYKGVHSAQVSFPGGKREKFDKDLYKNYLQHSIYLAYLDLLLEQYFH